MSAPPDIFLSNAREDQATARRFAQALQAEGFSVWWDQTLNAGDPRQLRFLWILRSAGLRSDPRFKQILRDFKVVDYWRESGNWGDFCKPVGDKDFEC